MERLTIIVETDGSVKIAVDQGPGGPGCKALTTPFVQAAGGAVTSDLATAEMYAPATEAVRQR